MLIEQRLAILERQVFDSKTDADELWRDARNVLSALSEEFDQERRDAGIERLRRFATAMWRERGLTNESLPFLVAFGRALDARVREKDEVRVDVYVAHREALFRKGIEADAPSRLGAPPIMIYGPDLSEEP